MRSMNPLRRSSPGFRLLAVFLLAYTVIAVLHGMAPQLWARHYTQNDDRGPFRVLIFTLFTALCLALCLLLDSITSGRERPPREHLPSRAVWSCWLLRGPPHHA